MQLHLDDLLIVTLKDLLLAADLLVVQSILLVDPEDHVLARRFLAILECLDEAIEGNG